MTFDDTPHTGDFFVSTDTTLLDFPFIVYEITHSYFGSWRSPMTISRSIQHSLCFGLYQRMVPISDGDRPGQVQVGFARIVTDYSTFAWLCDVIVTKKHRGKGLGKFLVRTVIDHPEVKPRSCLLSTNDAHRLYQQFGFGVFTAMKRVPATADAYPNRP